VNGTVRDLLAARGIALSPTDVSGIHGFICIGIAERVPELNQDTSSQVFVWHVRDDIFPVTASEVERWMIDAPAGKHWILSERDFDPSTIPDSQSIEAVVWGPKRMASWIGESVLSGDLGTFLYSDEEQNLSSEVAVENSEQAEFELTLKPLVELRSWLNQRGWDGVRTSPVLLSCRLWDIMGNLIGPNGQTESGNWKIIEDPWTSSFYIHEPQESLEKSPKLRVISNPSGWTAGKEKFPEEMLKLADQRRQGVPETNDDEVSSVMLEWWRLDHSSARGEYSRLTIPGWIVYTDEGESRILHGRNGRVYDIG
tara:strand:+ start:1021 stop:1956 length:936 start_codon:yes stop_codon:yes gene_type:complete